MLVKIEGGSKIGGTAHSQDKIANQPKNGKIAKLSHMQKLMPIWYEDAMLSQKCDDTELTFFKNVCYTSVV